MRKPRWYDVLEPREAVVAGALGFAVVYPITYYAFHHGYVLWGLTPQQWKHAGTAVDVLAFAIPYLVMKRHSPP
jgi:hypothetical protein